MATERYRAILSATDRVSPVLRRVTKVTAALGAVAGAVGAVQLGRQLVRGLEQSVQAAAKYEGATVRLAVALGNQGQFTQQNVEALQQYATELSKVSLATETQILDAVAQAKALGASDEAAKKLIASATDLASATGVDMQTAFRQVTRTLGGYAGELGELVPELKELTTEELRAGDAAAILNRKFGGAGAAGARTFEGALNNLNSSLERTRVLVGGPLTEVMREVVLELTNVVDGFNDAATESDSFRIAVIDLSIGFAEFGRTLEELTERTSGLRIALSGLFTGLDTEQLNEVFGKNDGLLELDPGFFDKIIARFEKLKESSPKDVLDGITNSVVEQTEAVALAAEAQEGYTETIERWGERLLTTAEAVEQYVQLGRVIDEVEKLDLMLKRTFRGAAVDGALAFGDALVDAAFAGELAFGKLFKAILKDIARAIVQALILRAILSFAGSPFGGGGIIGAASGMVVPQSAGLMVKGGIPGRDSVPIMAMPGEAVLPRELTEFLLRASAGPQATEIAIDVGPNMAAWAESITAEVRSGQARLMASDVRTTRSQR